MILDGNRWEKESIRQDMAARLKCLRENYPGGKLSHATLSEELEKRGTKISKDSLIKYESGSALRMNAEALLGLADFYGVSTDFLLCRTDDPAPVCEISPVDIFGLSSKALHALLEHDWWWQLTKDNGEVETCPVVGLSASSILSRLLEDEEFLQVLGNLANLTTPAHRRAIHDYDSSECPSEYPEDKLKLNPIMRPFKDSLWDMEISNAARHFGNAAERLLRGYDREEPLPDK